MKLNSKTTILMMASLLALSACTKSTLPTTGSTDSIDTNFPDEGSVFDKFSYTLVKNHSNCTVDVDGEYMSYYYSENAFFYDFGENYETQYGYVDVGYVKTSQGVFNYHLVNNQITLNECVTVSDKLSVMDMVIYPQHMLGNPEVWTVDESDPTKFTSKDADTVYAAAFLAGWADYSGYITDQTITAKFNSEDDYSTVKVSYKLKGAVTVDLVFTNIGTTESEKVSNFLKNPTILPNLSDYPQEMKEAMINDLGEEIPFVGASYASTFDAENKRFTDIGSGYSVLAKYKAAMLKAGWIFMASNSSSEKDSEGNPGLVKDYYIKRNYDSNNVLETINICQVAYVSGCYLDDYYWDVNSTSSKQFPNGQVIVSYAQKVYYNQEKYNNFVQALANKYKVTETIPSLVLPNSMYLSYSTLTEEIANAYGYFEYYGFEGYFADAATAKSTLQKYIDDLATAGFVAYNENELGKDVVTYYVNVDKYSFNIDIKYEEKDNDTNYFIICVSIAEAVVDFDGEEISWAEVKAKFNLMKIQVPTLPMFASTIQLDLESDVRFLDVTSTYEDLFGASVDEIYYSYFFFMTFDSATNAKLDMVDYAQQLKDAGFEFDYNSTTSEDITYDNIFDSEGIATAEMYNPETAIVCSTAITFTDANIVRIGFFTYKQITA